MKKLALFFLFVVIILNLFSHLVISLDAGDNLKESLGELEQTKKNIDEGVEKLSEKDIRREYLKQEWTKLLEKTSFGGFIIKTGKFLENLNPIFIFLIGIEFSLSWLFFLSLLIWIVIVVIVYKPLKEVGQFDGGLAFLISLAVAILAARTGGIRIGLNLYLLPIFENPWIIWMSVIVTFILVFIYWTYLRKSGRTIREMIKQSREERREYKAKIKEKLEDDELRAKGFKV